MIVVTGATGNVGRALVSQLTAADTPVRALTRDPQRANLPAGADAVRLVVSSEPADMAAQFAGATALFLHVAAGGEHTVPLLAAARDAGVEHVVVLSSIAVEDGAREGSPIHAMHIDLEQQVRDSGIDWTFLRPGAFSTNSRQWAPQIRTGDTVRGPFAKATSAPIHEADIAAVAHRALVERHAGVAHSLTGPAAATTEEQIQAIGDALGRELRFVEIPPEEVGTDLFPHVPAEMLPRMLELFATTVGVEPAITDTVEKVTGAPARTFAQWAKDHADDFRAPGPQ